MAQSGVYDLVADFGNLNIPAGASPSSITQTAGNVWTYQYENIAGNHDGTYTLMTNGWNANYRGYGLSSYVGGGGYPAGGNVRAVINPSENPAGVPVPDPADANYLQNSAFVGAGSVWEPLVIVWTAPQTGTAVIGITATNTHATSPAGLSLDKWNGVFLTVLDSTSLAGNSAYTLSATVAVDAGDEIHIWRDAYVDQVGQIAFSGTISLGPPSLTTVYDLVADFAYLALPAGAGYAYAQNESATWTYQYRNNSTPFHEHDGTYDLLAVGYNQHWRGLGLASLDGNGWPAGARVLGVVNAGDQPAGVLVPDPPSTVNFLQLRTGTGANSFWEPAVIVWKAPAAGSAAVSITATNASPAATQPTNLSLDHWDGATLTILDPSPLLAGGNSDTLTANLTVEAGDEIQVWRDSWVDQQGVIALTGTISLTSTPPLPAGSLLVIR